MSASNLTSNLHSYKQAHTCGALHSKGTHVKLQGDVVHKKVSNAMALHKMCPMLLLQASKDSNAPPKPCAPLGPLPLHEHCQPRCPQVSSMPPCKHPSYPMLSSAQHSPPECQMLLL